MRKQYLVIIPCVLFLVAISGCNSIENLTNSSSKLIIESITGTDLTGNAGSSIAFCDVIQSNGSIINDNGTVTMRAVTLDPLATSTTYYQDVIVDQIDIEYSRAEGLNVEGRDVPYRFSQRVTGRVEIGGSMELGFVLIQHTAKLESPLVDLVNGTQEHVLKLEARITIHSRDVAGNRLEPAVGYISVWCSNFSDSTGSGGGGSGGE